MKIVHERICTGFSSIAACSTLAPTATGSQTLTV